MDDIKKIVAGRVVVISSSILGGEFTNHRDVTHNLHVLSVTL
jgi:hypothetical protein